MSGFVGNLQFQLPPINKNNFLEKERELIHKIPMLSKIFDFPIFIGTKTASFDPIFSDLMNNEANIRRLIAERVAEILINSPKELISFDLFDINESQKFKEFPVFISSVFNQNKDYYHSLIKIIGTLLLRLPNELFTHETCHSIIEIINHNDKNSIFVSAFELRTLMLQLTENERNMLYVSKLIIPMSNILMKIYHSTYCDNILPFICPSLASSLFDAIRYVFEQNSLCAQEKLVCLPYFSLTFTTIAAVYPEAMLSIPWRSLVKFFGRNPAAHRDFFPTHSFQIEYPKSVACNQSCDNIIALVTAFSYFCQLSESNSDANMYLYLLQSLSSKNAIGQMACLRCLYTMSLYKEYEENIAMFLSMFDPVSPYFNDATILYINMMRNNYDPLTVEVEKKFRISEKILINIDKNQKSLFVPIKTISNIHSPVFDSKCTLEDLIRSVDGISSMKAYEAYSFNENSFITFLSQYITDRLKDGSCLTDFRKRTGFAHLCASYVSLIFKYRSFVGKNPDQEPLYANIYLILLIEDHILSLSTAVPSNKDIDNFQIAAVYRERMKIAQTIFKVGQRFFFVASEVCINQCPSLILPFLVILDDCLTIHLSESFIPNSDKWIDVDFINSIATDLSKWIICFMRSESRIVHDLMFELFVNLISTVLTHHKPFTDAFLTLFINEYKKLENNGNNLHSFTRIMHHYMRFMNIPITKSAFFTCKHFNETIMICAKIIINENIKYRSELSLMACDAIKGASSSNVSLISHVENSLRFVVDTLDSHLIPVITNNIKRILSQAETCNAKYIMCILRLVLCLCKNPHWVSEFKKQSLSFTFKNVKMISKLYSNPAIINYLFSITAVLSRIDTNYAKVFIGYEDAKALFSDPVFRSFDTRNEMINSIEFEDEKTLSIEKTLQELQEDPIFEKDYFFKKKVNSQTEALPINVSYSVLQPISDSNFSSEILVKGMISI